MRYQSLAGITPAWPVNAFPSPVSRIYGSFCPHVAEVVVLTTIQNEQRQNYNLITFARGIGLLLAACLPVLEALILLLR